MRAPTVTIGGAASPLDLVAGLPTGLVLTSNPATHTASVAHLLLPLPEGWGGRAGANENDGEQKERDEWFHRGLSLLYPETKALGA